MIQINKDKYIVKVASIIRTIIETVGIKPDENYTRNDAQKREQDNKKSD